jgi:hypothetical protein
MALTVTVTPGYTFASSGELVTPAKLNQLGQPTFTVTGTTGTSDLAAGAVTTAKTTPGAYWYAGSTFAANVYTVTLSPALAAYADGAVLAFKAAAVNTASASVNVNGLGNKVIKKNSSMNLVAGDIVADQIVEIRYDSTNGWFHMVSPIATQPPAIPTLSQGLLDLRTPALTSPQTTCCSRMPT